METEASTATRMRLSGTVIFIFRTLAINQSCFATWTTSVMGLWSMGGHSSCTVSPVGSGSFLDFTFSSHCGTSCWSMVSSRDPKALGKETGYKEIDTPRAHLAFPCVA